MTEFSIGELASDFGLTLRTLRFWEGRKLLNPVRRGLQRVYTIADRDSVRNIIAWSAAGLSLREIREMQSMPPTTLRAFLHQRLPEIRAVAEHSHAQQIAAIDALCMASGQEQAA